MRRRLFLITLVTGLGLAGCSSNGATAPATSKTNEVSVSPKASSTLSVTPPASISSSSSSLRQIAYIGSDGNVWLGSEALQAFGHELTADGGDASPRWSPDGKSISFVHKDDANGDTVDLINTDGSKRHTVYGPVAGVAPTAWSSLDNVRWSADGCTLYVIVSGGPSYDHHVHGEPLCGGQSTDAGTAHHLDVSVSGQFAVSSSQSATPPHVDVGSLENPSVSILDYGAVAWSPDGTRLAVRSTNSIRIYDLSGTLLQSYIVAEDTDDAYSQGLDWSKDGQVVAFDSVEVVTILSLDTGVQLPIFAGSQPDFSG